MHTALQSSIDKVGALSAFDDKEMTWNMKDKNKNAKTEEKTNVMRILDSKKIKYNHYCYVETGETNGEKVAAILGQDPAYVYKTLVTVAKSGANYVFVIPVKEELDLKKAAKAVGEKSIICSRQRNFSSYRIYTWRLLTYRYEEVFQDHDRCKCSKS